MKKIISLLLVCMLAGGGLSVAAMSENAITIKGTMTATGPAPAQRISLTTPSLTISQQNSNYVHVSREIVSSATPIMDV